MSRRKEPAIPNELLDQLLAGSDAGAALAQGGLLDALKKALAERALNAEMDHHLAGEDGTGNSRNGYGRKTITTDTGIRGLIERIVLTPVYGVLQVEMTGDLAAMLTISQAGGRRKLPWSGCYRGATSQVGCGDRIWPL